MKIVANRRSVKADKNNEYLYFTKHGVGPGTLPKDVKLLDWRDVDDNITAIWLDRFLTTKELNQYDIYPETSDQHKMYSKKLNSCTITASRPANSYQHYYAYDYKGKNRFSIHYDDVTDIEDPELSFKQFRASVSPIKPYDDADYAWARIQSGSVDYFREGKLIKKEYYFMFSDYGTDEAPLYENANEWITDVTDHTCDTLIELNQNVKPRIIHNSKSIQSAAANKGVTVVSDTYYNDDFDLETDWYNEEELQEIIDELTEDGFDVTDEADLLMGLSADLGMDRADARYYAKLILNHIDDSSVLGAVGDDEIDFNVEDTHQEYHSDATSINSNKLPAIYKMVQFHPGDVVLDFGGGKFDNAVNYLKDKDVTLLVYDPYNRSAEHNDEVIRILREHGGADSAVNSNVLNVIKEPEARETVLRNIKRLTKKGAPIYITVYEGKGDKKEGPTKSGYQLNRKTADYMEEIQEVFPDATRKGKLITAINASEDLTTSEIDNILGNLRADLHTAILETFTSSEFGFDEKEVDEYSRIDVDPDPDYDGIRIEVGAELSYEGLDKLREILDKTLNLYVKDAYFDMAEPGILETYFASTDIIPDSVESCQTIEAGYYDVPERPLDPPEYEEGDEVEAEATIEVSFNQVITIDRDGGWSYSDEEYNFTKTDDGKSDHYDDEYHVYLDDNVGIVEKLDEFLEEKLPATPGTYRIQGDLTLVYDIENIRQYSNNDGYWSDEDGFNPPSYETYTDDAEAYYNKSKSSLDNFKYTKIK